MKSWMRKAHLGPLGMVLAMIDTSRGRALVYDWRYLVAFAIVALAAICWLAVHFG